MKKVLTFVLALVMVLALAAPALAFTGKDKDESTDPWKISIQLVDYSAANFTRGAYYTELPTADRGYLKNEMVGAVISLYVPAEAENDQTSFQITTENVNLYEFIGEKKAETANDILGIDAFGTGIITAILNGKKTPVYPDTPAAVSGRGDATYRYLVLGQLIGASGSITAKVVDSTDNKKIPAEGVVLKDYTVTYANKVYSLLKGGMLMKIEVDGNNYCTGMRIRMGSTSTSIGVGNLADNDEFKVQVMDGNIVFIQQATTNVNIPQNKIIDNAAGTRESYAELLKFYNGVKSAFGIDRTASGYLYDSFFYGIKGTKGVSATAYLEPYVASITVPDVVVDPPKTGDASTLVGIVMVIAALAGVVVMKKVRA